MLLMPTVHDLHLLLSECYSVVFPGLSVDQAMLRRNSLT
jgi:hypothetical protein